MDKIGGFLVGCFVSSIIWLFILVVVTGNAAFQMDNETSTANKNEIVVYAEKFPEIAEMRVKAYENKYISNEEYYMIRKHYNYLVETKK